MRNPPYKWIVLATLVVSVVAIVLALTQGARLVHPARSEQSGSLSPRVEIRRLEPSRNATNLVECASLGFVNFTYEVFNRGEVPITGLKLGTKCGCEAVRDPPREIPAGASAPFSFRVRAPFAGKIERTIPLLADGDSEPVAEFHTSLRVKFEPPALVPPSDSLSLTFVNGDHASRELVFEAIEAKRDKPWICGLDLSVQDDLEPGPLRIEEFPEMDPDLTRRRYCFPVANRSLPLGQHMATVTFRTLGRSPRAAESAAVWVNVVDSVAIVPNPLVIKYPQGSTPPSRRVLVVDRTGNQSLATPMKFDHDLLRVEAAGRQGGSTVAFNVAALETPDVALETQVVFNVGAVDTRMLVIRFEPSEQR